MNNTPTSLYSDFLEKIIPEFNKYLDISKSKTIIFRGPKVLVTDSYFSISGISYKKTPIIFDSYGDFIEVPSKWLIYLRTTRTSKGSVLQYASAICSFWRHLQKVAHRDWQKVDDTLLRDWRNRMTQGVDSINLEKRKRTINNKLHVVIEFYKWAQEYGYVKNIIGITQPNHPPFPIRLVEVNYRNRSKKTSPLIYKTRKPPLLPIPTNEEIDSLYTHIAGSTPAARRNVLLTKWALDSGMRESEILNRVISDIPPLVKCQELIDSDRIYWLEIIGKGGKQRIVPVTPEVLIETHRFITSSKHRLCPRDLMLKRRIRNTKEDKIFLSARTGEPLNRQSVSHIFSKTFLLVTGQSNRRKLHFHRLRARFASRLVQELAIQTMESGRSIFELDEQKILLERAADILGHQDTQSLKHYLNTFLDRNELAVSNAARKSRR